MDRLIAVGHEVEDMRDAKARLLTVRAMDQINCPTRQYYLQCAKELRGS